MCLSLVVAEPAVNPFNCAIPPSVVVNFLCSAYVTTANIFLVTPPVVTGGTWAELTWNGWAAVGSVSFYIWTKFSLVDQNGVLVPGRNGAQYRFYSPPNIHPFRVKSLPGMYPLTLAVYSGKSVTKAQQLLLVDKNSVLVKCANHPPTVPSGLARDGRVWQTTESNRIEVRWFGRYYNDYLRLNKWLLYPVRRDLTVRGEYRLAGYPLSYDGIATYNGSGVLSFNASLHMRADSVFNMLSSKQMGAFNQSLEVGVQLQSGHLYRVVVTAIDVFGHTASDAVDVLTDFTPPHLSDVSLVQTAYRSIRNLPSCAASQQSQIRHSLSFRAVDSESGINRTEWTVVRANGLNAGSGVIYPTDEEKVYCLTSVMKSSAKL